jgi:ferredoxin-NADP reductase
MQRLIPSTAFDFYVCGPSAMMDSVTRDFEAWGVPADRMHTEAFGPATIKQALHGPTAQPDCGFDVTFARSGVTAAWSRCDSPLLEFAEEHSPLCPTCAPVKANGAARTRERDKRAAETRLRG